MRKLTVNLGRRSYDIVIGYKVLPEFGRLLRKLKIGSDAVVVTNPYIRKLYGDRLENSLKEEGFSVRFEEVPDSETSKSDKMCLNLIKRIALYDEQRTLFIIAFGGGVIGDLAGFLASIYKRGIPYVQLPTTLLAQVDSSIGGKVGIDLTYGKNLIGAFYQPRLVFSDISLLKSLNLRQLRSGLAEVIKYGIIQDENLFRYIEKRYSGILKLNENDLIYVVLTSSKIKARIVEEDETDTGGKRMLLNLGHTIGHAIEAASKYAHYSHGEAIAIGTVCAAQIAKYLGLLSPDSFQRIENLILKVGLPVKIQNVKLTEILKAQLHDKKFIGRKNRFVLPAGIGKAEVRENVPLEMVKKVIKSRLECT